MKRFFQTILFATAIMVACSCEELQKDGAWDPVELDKSNIEFTAEGGQETVTALNYTSWWINGGYESAIKVNGKWEYTNYVHASSSEGEVEFDTQKPIPAELSNQNKEEVQAYIDETLKKSDMDRTELNKGKSGCPLKGIYAINPVNGKEVPVFIGDFVLASYGTGAVMAVPSHDQRDFEYAIAHNIDMIQVIEGRDVSKCAFEKQDYLGKGCKLINSEEFSGLTVEEAKKAIT